MSIAKKELQTAERRDSVNDLSIIIANVYQHNDRCDQVAALVQSQQSLRVGYNEPPAGGTDREQAEEIMDKKAPKGGG